MATLQELESALVKADAAGNAEDARALTGAIDQMRAIAPATPPPTTPTQPPAPRPNYGEDLARISERTRIPGQNIPSGEYGRRTPRTQAQAIEAQQAPMRQAGEVIKYAPAVAAGIATGGASIIPQMLATGSAGFLGSSAEQLTRPGDEQFSTREALATGLETSIPIVRLAPITPFMSTARAVATAGARAAATGATAAGLGEAATAVREGEAYQPPKNAKEAMGRLFTPGALVAGAFAGAGGVGERVAGRGALASQVAAQRGVTGPTSATAPSATVMLTDILPQYAPLEARSLIAKNPKALAQLRDMTVNIDESIMNQFASAPNAAQIAGELAPNVGKLKSLQEAARAADATKVQAQAAYQNAIATGRTDVKQMLATANEAALEASKQKALLDLGIDRLFGPQKPALAAISPAQNTAALSGLLEDTFNVQREALGSLYEQAGIGVNDAVIDKAGLVSAINRKAGDSRSMLAGNEARRAAIDQVNQLFSGGDTLTLEQFRNARNAIATGLEDNKLFSSAAGKLAGETYDVIRGASNNYIAKTTPDKFPAWQKANETAANWYKARDSAFIQDFVDPSTGTLRQGKAGEFVNALTAGKVEGFADLEKLGASIAATGDPAALAAAEQFRKGVSKYIATGILDTAATNRAAGLASDAATFDASKLYKTLNQLQSRGFPVEQLGMGTPRDINSLARIAEGRGVTKAELNEFFTNVGSLGGDVAAARIAYRRQLVDNLLGLGSGSKVANIQKTQQLARRAKIDATTAQTELTAAQNDPLVKLFEEGSYGLSPDPTLLQDQWVSSLRRFDPSRASKLMNAAPPAIRDGIRARTAADLLAQYSGVTPGVTPSANVATIGDFLFSPAAANERATVRSIMGNQEYDKFTKIAKDLAPILRTQHTIERAAGVLPGSAGDALKGAGAAGGLLTGRLQTGTVAGAGLSNVRKLLDRGQYNLLYQLYVNPKWAPKFARAGYNVERFASESGLHRVVVQMADRDDYVRLNQADQEQAAQ